MSKGKLKEGTYKEVSQQEVDESNPYLSDTRLVHPVPSEGDAPPFTRLHFRNDKPGKAPEGQEWIMAESWWAGEFTPPTYTEAIPLALSIGPWILEQTGLGTIGKLFDASLNRPKWTPKKARQNQAITHVVKPPDNAFAWLQEAGVWGAQALGTGLLRVGKVSAYIISTPLLLFVGLIAQLLVLALWLLAYVPPLRGSIIKLQLSLTGWLGDAIVMAASTVRFNAMVSQIQRDIEWLADKGGCEAVAVVAHSGGAVVAHKAVTGPNAVQLKDGKNILLITYGSGQSKVSSIRQALIVRPFFLRFNPLLRVLAGFSFLVAIVLLMQKIPPAPWVAGALTVAIAATILQWGIGVVTSKALKPLPFEQPSGNEWIDYAAVADIVPGGNIDSPGIFHPRSPTKQVDNLHSPLKDHGWYWNNDEEFTAQVSRLLYAKATGKDLAEGASEILHKAEFRRESRVSRYLGSGISLLWSLPVLWFVLGPWLGRNIGEPLRQMLVTVLSLARVNVHTPFGQYVSEDFWAYLVGMTAVAIVVALFNTFFILPVWSSWSRAEKEAMFTRNFHKGSGKWKRRALAFLLLSVLTPAVVVVAAILETYTKIGLPSFPKSVEGFQSYLTTILHVPLLDVLITPIGSPEFAFALTVFLLGFAACVLITSVADSIMTWRRLSLEPAPRPDDDIFNTLLNRLLVNAPVRQAPVQAPQRDPVTVAGDILPAGGLQPADPS
jgi:riboflavin transporter FmnP